MALLFGYFLAVRELLVGARVGPRSDVRKALYWMRNSKVVRVLPGPPAPDLRRCQISRLARLAGLWGICRGLGRWTAAIRRNGSR